MFVSYCTLLSLVKVSEDITKFTKVNSSAFCTDVYKQDLPDLVSGSENEDIYDFPDLVDSEYKNEDDNNSTHLSDSKNQNEDESYLKVTF